jgi:1-deoxy-D-xylulose-5-phosphate reductoisomerase
MKIKIAVLGSTGSIGVNTLKIIKKNKKNFQINLLSTNKNVNKIYKQVKEFNVKSIIITDLNSYKKAKFKLKKTKINIFNNFEQINKIIKTKNDIIINAISGLNGLLPTLKLIKFTKKILIANKESIICGWDLINDELKKNKTNFIPIDSEHFSLWSLLEGFQSNDIEKIYITASGGPFLKSQKKNFSKITIKETLNHPNWKMGKKITVDSSTLMNKVFEVIEAKNIFNLEYNRISVLTHPKSYLHAIIKFKNGLSKMLLHIPDMKIPIHNSIFSSNIKKIKTPPINFEILNNLELNKIDTKKFPIINLLKILPKKSSLFETVLITINDYLVFKFLEKKINYQKLIHLIIQFTYLHEFQKFKKIKPKTIDDIFKVRNYVCLKLDTLGI